MTSTIVHEKPLDNNYIKKKGSPPATLLYFYQVVLNVRSLQHVSHE